MPSKALSLLLVAVVVVANLCTAGISATTTPPPIIITLSGKRDFVAYRIGQITAGRIRERLQRSDIKSGILPFVSTKDGEAIYNQLVTRAKAVFPEYVDELHHLANGAGVSFKEVFVLNALQELSSYTPANTTTHPPLILKDGDGKRRSAATSRRRRPSTFSHCTDILSQPQPSQNASTNHAIWGHNEDGGIGDRTLNYFVNLTILSPAGIVIEQFVAYNYVGTVAGLAYGWNAKGLLMSENAIFGEFMNYRNVPTSLVARALLGQASSLDNAISLVRKHHGSVACNINLGEYPSGRLVTMEVDPFTYTISPRELLNLPPQDDLPGLTQSPTSFIHVNIFQVLTSSAGFPDPSSTHRLEALAKYAPPQSSADIATMLGDTSDPVYPVYRNGTAEDQVQTLTTVIFDIAEGVAYIFDTNPRELSPVFNWTLF